MLRCNGSISEVSTRVVELTEKEKKSEYQNMPNQTKMDGLPTRRRRFMAIRGHMMLQNVEKNTCRIARVCVGAWVRGREMSLSTLRRIHHSIRRLLHYAFNNSRRDVELDCA